eukprot:jgi/Astpho2/4497/fgenesh1_pg.00067_%23_75_t
MRIPVRLVEGMLQEPTTYIAAGGDDDDFQDLDAPEPEDVSSDDEGAQPAAQDPAVTADGKTKKKRKKPPKGQRQSALEYAASREVARTITQRSTAEQAKWLSSIDPGAGAATALDVSPFTDAHVQAVPLEGTLEERLSHVHDWEKLFCNTEQAIGKPSALLVTSSAVGAVNIIRQLPNFNKACRIGKLFAKHFKVPEQQDFLAVQPVCLAVGTPHRLLELATLGSLKLDKLKLILVDVQLDAKQRTLLDQPETSKPFWDLIHDYCTGLSSGQTAVALLTATTPQLST